MGWPLFISSVVSLGFVFCLFWLLFFFYWRRPPADGCQISVVPVLKNSDCLELIVGELMRKGRWDRKITRLYVLLWDGGTEKETEKLCHQICKRWEDNVWYCDTCESVGKTLQELLIAKNSEF